MRLSRIGIRPRHAAIAALIAAAVAGGGVTVALRKTTSKDQPARRSAQAEADQLLTLARLPAGAVAISCQRYAALRTPAFEPSSDQLIDHHRCLRVPMPFDRAVDWFRSHPPHGLTLGLRGAGSTGSSFGYTAADTSAYREAQLAVSIAPDSASASVVRLDGLAIYVSSIPIRVTDRGPRIRVTTTSGCPASLGKTTDVSNAANGLTKTMLPAGYPVRGVICTFASIDGGRARIRQIELGSDEAVRLARAIKNIPLGSAGLGPHGCPNDTGATDVIAFGYQDDLQVDLWFHASGCRTLDNGYVIVEEIGNPAFYGAFEKLMTSFNP